MTTAYQLGQQARDQGKPIEHGHRAPVFGTLKDYEEWTAEFRKGWQDKDANEAEEQEDDDDDYNQDVEKFEIPIPGKQSVKVIVPSDLDADDWEMLQSMITVYVRRWKGFAAAPQKTANEADH